MTECNTTLKKQHSFKDYLYWNAMLAVPFLAVCIGLYQVAAVWMVVYIILAVGYLLLVYRYFCTYCPHYIRGDKTVKCMFLWGVPRLFKPNPGPMSSSDKVFVIAISVLFTALPVYWLRLEPGYLALYLLSGGVFAASVRRQECGRCIHFQCVSNCVPDELKPNE